MLFTGGFGPAAWVVCDVEGRVVLIAVVSDVIMGVFLLDDSGALQSTPSLDFLQFEHIRGLMMAVLMLIITTVSGPFASRGRLIRRYGQLPCPIELVIGVGCDTLLRHFVLLLRYYLRVVLHGALLECVLVHFTAASTVF